MSSDARAELARLEAEARALSTRRRRLRDRIDFLRGGGDESDELQAVIDEERQVSANRSDLHRRIDELRTALGLEPGAPKKDRLLD
jgi:hypothetical protein